jgi:hypothetical protein
MKSTTSVSDTIYEHIRDTVLVDTSAHVEGGLQLGFSTIPDSLDSIWKTFTQGYTQVKLRKDNAGKLHGTVTELPHDIPIKMEVPIDKTQRFVKETVTVVKPIPWYYKAAGWLLLFSVLLNLVLLFLLGKR